MGTLREREFIQSQSHGELIAKIEQLQSPASAAAIAIAGLSLLLLGESNDQILQMVAKGRSFLNYLEDDLDYDKRSSELSSSEALDLLIYQSDRYYQPAEVIPKDTEDIQQKINSIKRNIDRITGKSPNKKPTTDEIKKTLDDLYNFSRGYEDLIGETLSELKSGPSVNLYFC